MLALFIWGFALYGICVMLWRIFRFLMSKSRKRVPVTAVMIVQEGASYMEGILRTLTTAEPFVGSQLEILVIDCGSRDETTRIVEAISSRRPTIRLLHAQGVDPYQAMMPHLAQRTRHVPCIFDLRGRVSPQEVVPTLAGFWSELGL
ncbi:hypothetical protein [Tumebacillus flagellatus]|uniref:Glycosyltransferase 2-like domain-containing protein n=1 Tax=Tumebacillus flagellatus TaxID=1157490 RepID=A0A074MDZ1_9BACL|nr:hypothetical protein [Tumebacillus flagellatus]KEO84047.1 hypothetical protein EL26_06170 [Tumebacillus flagellatus]